MTSNTRHELACVDVTLSHPAQDFYLHYSECLSCGWISGIGYKNGLLHEVTREVDQPKWAKMDWHLMRKDRGNGKRTTLSL